jgi:hypothetical protein
MIGNAQQLHQREEELHGLLEQLNVAVHVAKLRRAAAWK